MNTTLPDIGTSSRFSGSSALRVVPWRNAGQTMSIFNSQTGDSSSRLAKGVAKEKQLTRDLKFKHPSASVTRTSPTGDGGKDVIVDFGGECVFHEIKNWEQAMTAYDLRQYITLHQNADASLEIYNEGGFTTTARAIADEAGVKLTSGSEYTSPGYRHLLRWSGYQVSSRVSAGRQRFTSSSYQYGCWFGKVGKKLLYNGLKPAAKYASRIARKCFRKLSFKQIGVALVVLGPLWLYYKHRKGEYKHDHAIGLVLGAVICFILSSLFDK